MGKIKEFWNKYEQKIVLIVGIILISIVSFEVGALKGQEWKQEPLVIEKASEGLILGCSDTKNDITSKVSTKSNSKTPTIKNTKCAYAGSKNSDKYHSPDCQWFNRIKKENRVCFSSIEDAKNKGYVPGSCLKK